jgi:hypothetical protein
MKPVSYRGRNKAMCWECEAPTSDPVETALGSLAALTARVILCPDCYQVCYVPLIAQVAGSLPMKQTG